MFTVRRALGLRFVIYSNDHMPAHVHVVGSGCEAKVQLQDMMEVVWSVGFKPSDLRRITAELAREREMLLAKWDEIHG